MCKKQSFTIWELTWGPYLSSVDRLFLEQKSFGVAKLSNLLYLLDVKIVHNKYVL